VSDLELRLATMPSPGMDVFRSSEVEPYVCPSRCTVAYPISSAGSIQRMSCLPIKNFTVVAERGQAGLLILLHQLVATAESFRDQ
jgi:hypothetical protein